MNAVLYMIFVVEKVVFYFSHKVKVLNRTLKIDWNSVAGSES